MDRNAAETTGRPTMVQSGTKDEATPDNIKRSLERIGARYLADLRTLSEEFNEFYGAQLTAKDERIAELTRRLEAAERAQQQSEARNRELEATVERHIATLRGVYEGVSQSLQDAGVAATRMP